MIKTRQCLNCNLIKEFDNFLIDCANCSDCAEVLNENCICPEHGSEWDQVYKHHYEILQMGDEVK